MTELPVDENTPRILIVEDEPKLGQLLIDYLQAAGYAPTLINHGDKVLPYVRQTPPHLILLDIHLPTMDGYDVARALRGNPVLHGVPIVAVTSYAMPGDRERALAAGCNGYIEKPIDPDTFVAEIDTYLRGAQGDGSP